MRPIPFFRGGREFEVIVVEVDHLVVFLERDVPSEEIRDGGDRWREVFSFWHRNADELSGEVSALCSDVDREVSVAQLDPFPVELKEDTGQCDCGGAS